MLYDPQDCGEDEENHMTDHELLTVLEVFAVRQLACVLSYATDRVGQGYAHCYVEEVDGPFCQLKENFLVPDAGAQEPREAGQ